MFSLLLFVAFIGPYLPFIDNTLSQDKHRWSESGKLVLPPYEPSNLNWLGSDRKGVDNLSKLVMATKETIYIIIATTLLRYLIAVPLGIVAHWRAGFIRHFVSVVHQVFSFLPTIFSVMLLINLPSLLNTPNRFYWSILILAFVEAGRVAYIVQQQVQMISKEPYFEAATVSGLSNLKIARNYYLPALLPELIVNFCIDLGKVTILIGQLGVMEIFISQMWVEVAAYTKVFINTSLNWITLLSANRGDIYVNRFSFIFFPAGAILFTILTFNVLGEGFRKMFSKRENI